METVQARGGGEGGGSAPAGGGSSVAPGSSGTGTRSVRRRARLSLVTACCPLQLLHLRREGRVGEH